jgi:hypothetical protein
VNGLSYLFLHIKRIKGISAKMKVSKNNREIIRNCKAYCVYVNIIVKWDIEQHIVHIAFCTTVNKAKESEYVEDLSNK